MVKEEDFLHLLLGVKRSVERGVVVLQDIVRKSSSH